MVFKEKGIRWCGIDLTGSGQGHIRALVNRVLNLWFPYNMGNLIG
jgi:hypothetical protein